MPDLLKKLSINAFFKFGAPFVGLLLVGTFGLKQFIQLKYTYSGKKEISKEEEEKLGFRKEKKTLEDQYQEIHDIDLDEWKNIRGPRPWETKEGLLELQSQMKEIKQKQERQ